MKTLSINANIIANVLHNFDIEFNISRKSMQSLSIKFFINVILNIGNNHFIIHYHSRNVKKIKAHYCEASAKKIGKYLANRESKAEVMDHTCTFLRALCPPVL